jgi:uncharacterized protein (TIGR03083 family)
MTLPDDELFEAFDAAMALFASLDRDRATTPVPSCPGWSVADLMAHLGSVQRWATLVVSTRASIRPRRDKAEPGPDVDRGAWLAEGAAALRSALGEADRDATVWSLRGLGPVRWWLRRQTHEATVHALDAADAVGATWTPAPEVAADGVDEALEVFLPLLDEDALAAVDGSVHLHATDATGEWLLRFGEGGVEVTREHAKGDVAARGPAVELLRLVWGRPPGSGLDVFGDTAVLDRFRAASRY